VSGGAQTPDAIDEAIQVTQQVRMAQIQMVLNRADGSQRPLMIALPVDLQNDDVLAVMEAVTGFARQVIAQAEAAKGPQLVIAHGALPRPA
jgi:hypothetical protein